MEEMRRAPLKCFDCQEECHGTVFRKHQAQAGESPGPTEMREIHTRKWYVELVCPKCGEFRQEVANQHLTDEEIREIRMSWARAQKK